MAAQMSITVHVTPRSGRDEVMGIKCFDDGLEAVCVRVTAPPDAGKANKAVCKAVSGSLGVPKSAVEVLAGHTARRKRLSIAADEALLNAWLAALPHLS